MHINFVEGEFEIESKGGRVTTHPETKTGKPSRRARVVREDNGDFKVYFDRVRNGAWTTRIRADGTMTPGSLKRLERHSRMRPDLGPGYRDR